MRGPNQPLPLVALRTFEAAARLLSFKDAAQELRVSATSVSNHIRRLERDWQCQLFVRKTRRVVLTEAGRSLADVVGRAFADIRTEIEGRLPARAKAVTVAVGPIFGSRWLTPRLGAFRRHHAKIELVLHHGARISSAEHLGTSIAVDWGMGDWPGLEATHLLDVTYRPVVSPALLSELGGMETPADLARYPILHQQDRTEWMSWFKLAGHPGLRLNEESVIVDSNVVLQAALDGQGVALGIFPFVRAEVDQGRLVCPFEIELRPRRSYYLLTRPGARHAPEVAAVCSWFEAEALATRRAIDAAGSAQVVVARS